MALPPSSPGAVHEKDAEVAVDAVEVKEPGALGLVIHCIVDLIRPARLKAPL
jgi:hypothetical protein